MKVAIHRLSTTAWADLLETLVGFGASYALFGDRILIYGPDANWEEIKRLAEAAGLTLQEYAFPVDADNLYLVIQTGALFEQAHPDVPIILNASRYLAVNLDPHQVAGLDETRCGYKIQRLEPNVIVFDIRTPPPDPPATVPWIEALVKQLSGSKLKQGVEHLVRFPTRYSTTRHYSEAAGWATEQLEAMGYNTVIDPISILGSRSRNVVASKARKGSGKQGIILIVAHLDSINKDNPMWLAPGADDNASGSVGLLEIARVMKNHHGANELRFVLFGGEEDGLYGSDQYVKLLCSSNELERVKAVVCMDMIATMNCKKLTVLLEGADISQSMIDGLTSAAFTYSPSLTVTTSTCHYGSDHMPFIWASRPAVLTIEGNGAEPNQNIHTANDNLSYINYELMLAILRMNTAFLAECVGP